MASSAGSSWCRSGSSAWCSTRSAAGPSASPGPRSRRPPPSSATAPIRTGRARADLSPRSLARRRARRSDQLRGRSAAPVERDEDAEGRALADAGFELDLGAEQIGEPRDQREPEADAAVALGIAVLDLAK